jgi:hypothetical protein
MQLDQDAVAERALDDHRDLTIAKVWPTVAGDYWTISFHEVSERIHLLSSEFHIDVPRDLVPEPGATMRRYGPTGDRRDDNGARSGVAHGWDLAGHRLYYHSRAQRMRLDWPLGQDPELGAELEQRFNRNRVGLEARLQALSAPLRARIETMRLKLGMPAWLWEPDEVSISTDAERIAALLRLEHGWREPLVSGGEANAAIARFQALTWSQQKHVLPDLDDGHSRDTFSGACRLAVGLVTGELG